MDDPSPSPSPSPYFPERSSPELSEKADFPPSASPVRPAASLAPIHAHHHLARTPSCARPRSQRLASLLKPWMPVILYVATTLGFVLAVAFYKDEVFARLDELSGYLREDETYGQAVMFLLIFITTIPPFPLYSTFIVLAGYTFGAWRGALVSYLSALSGALAVFLLSRTPLLRPAIARWLASTRTLRRVVCAVERRPALLFLIRLAPYPYNVMNCLLAAAPRLGLGTYAGCTALSLLKVIVHTSVGAGMHSFREYHAGEAPPPPPQEGESTSDYVARLWTLGGAALCIAIFVYLSVVARRAVDDELGDGDGDGLPLPASSCERGRGRERRGSDEETVAFLSERGVDDAGGPMAESPWAPVRVSSPAPAPGRAPRQ